MPPYKRQHYLPAAYLKYFSTDQLACSRGSWIWRYEGKAQRHVPVVSQCSGDYHFSRENAAETEAMFQGVENAYCQCVDAVKGGKTLNGAECGNLFLAIIDFQLRSNIHENLTGHEGIVAYNVRSLAFMREILLGKKSGNTTNSEIIDHIQNFWSISFFSPIKGSHFITSDNPSAWITLLPLRPALHVVLLPLTPEHLAFAFDKRILEVVGDQMTLEDEQTLNCCQLQNAEQCIYSAGRLSDEQIFHINLLWDGADRSRGAVRESAWQLWLAGLKHEHRFSFVRLKPPLM